MRGADSRRRIARVPAGLLGMLALVAIVEMRLSARHLDFTTTWADDWRRTAEAASTRVKSRDVLFFGDSMVKFGVLPKAIEAQTGLRSYNLAVNAGTMPTTYFLLRRAIDSGARPKAIVADFFPLMMFEDPHGRVRAYSDLATVRDCVDLGWTTRDARLATETLAGKLLTSYQCRYDIRYSIRLAFQGLRASDWPAHSAVWATWEAQDGAQPMPRMPWGFAYDPVLAGSLVPERWSCHPVDASYVDRFLALAASKGIPVYWLMPPMSPTIHALRRPIGADEAYDRFARSLQGRYPNVMLVDARNSGYDDSVHNDVLHLNHQGAKILSADLATLLADRLRAPATAPADGWVALPPVDGRSGDEPVRSIARSSGPTVR